MIHTVKCNYNYFNFLNDGSKTFEVRKKDRLYEIGDFLAVNEFIPEENHDPYTISEGLRQASGGYYTGNCLFFKITYILDDAKFLKDGMVVLGLARREI